VFLGPFKSVCGPAKGGKKRNTRHLSIPSREKEKYAGCRKRFYNPQLERGKKKKKGRQASLYEEGGKKHLVRALYLILKKKERGRNFADVRKGLEEETIASSLIY